MTIEDILVFVVINFLYFILLGVIVVLVSRSIEIQCFLKRLLSPKKDWGLLDVIKKDGRIKTFIISFAQDHVEIDGNKIYILPDRVVQRNKMPYAIFAYNEAQKEIYNFDISNSLTGKVKKVNPEVLKNTLDTFLTRSAVDPLLKVLKNLNLFQLIQIGLIGVTLVLVYLAMDSANQSLATSRTILEKVVAFTTVTG